MLVAKDLFRLFFDLQAAIVVTLHHLLDPLSALREMARVCVPDGRIVVVDAYAPDDAAQANAYNRVERLRDPSHARALSLTELKGLFGRLGLPEPQITCYELPVKVTDLLARAFPSPGDHAKIIEMFEESASSGRLGIPVRLDGDEIHVTYRAANHVSQRTQEDLAT
jgi:SAM-dependent methyltransferase